MHSSARALAGSLCLAVFGLLVGCAGLLSLQGRSESHAIEPDGSTPLGRALMPLARGNPGKSGVAAIEDGRLAFDTRLHLARSAARSIDIQTYIWYGDATEDIEVEPETGWFQRLLVRSATRLPGEWLL